MARILLKNQSKMITDDLLKIMVETNQIVLDEFARLWDMKTMKILAFDKNTIQTKEDFLFTISDGNPENESNALAYHTISQYGMIYGYILVGEILKYGGKIINPTDNMIKDDKPNRIYSEKEQHSFKQVSTVFSATCHEILETFYDKFCNVLWQSWHKPKYYVFCGEVCDMVQDKNIVLHHSGIDVHLSDFVLPAWSNPYALKGPYNYRNTLKNSFTLDKGGYAIVYLMGTDRSINGKRCQIVGEENIPPWKREKSQRMKSRKNLENLDSCSIQ